MSTYATTSLVNYSMAIQAGALELRIIQVVVSSLDLDVHNLFFARYTSGTMSGDVLGISPLRQGAPAALATARGSTTTSSNVTGTRLMLQAQWIAAGGEIILIPGASELNYHYSGSSSNFQPPLTATIPPGGFFQVQNITAEMACTVYFEEIRIPGST